MSDRFSRSKKCATVMFIRPGIGRSTYQELPGKVDENLRRAIEKAYGVFWDEYIKGMKEAE